MLGREPVEEGAIDSLVDGVVVAVVVVEDVEDWRACRAPQPGTAPVRRRAGLGEMLRGWRVLQIVLVCGLGGEACGKSRKARASWRSTRCDGMVELISSPPGTERVVVLVEICGRDETRWRPLRSKSFYKGE